MKKGKRVLWGMLAMALVFALAPAGCDGVLSDEGNSFETKLRGTWETHEPEPYGYSGMLVIGWNTITITGYDQNYYGLKESERPFKGITKGVSRKGYTKEGKMYLNDFGWKEGIAYEYDPGTFPDYTELLRFTFGGRNETLQKSGE